MSAIVLLIIFSIIVALIFLVSFIWAVRTGQFDDMESPSIRILFDEKSGKSGKSGKNENQEKDKEEG